MTDLQKKYSWVNQPDYEAVAGDDWPTYEVFCQHNSVNNEVYHEIDNRLSQPNTFGHPSFCILPFYGYEIPSNTACCLMTKHNIDDVRKEMLSGIRPTACQKCWTLEDKGIISDRLIKNSSLDFYQKKDIGKIFQECLDGNYQTTHYKIDTSNICNATCLTCSDGASTAWGKLKQNNDQTFAKEWKLKISDLQNKINFENAEVIIFRGGEPFLSDTNFQILEKLIDHGNYDCFVSFSTNGSFKLSKRHKQILKNFKNLNFSFSLDGTDLVFDYMRYPLKFDQIKKNILYCRQNNIIPSVHYTLSNINILYHSQTINWFKEQKLDYMVSPIYDPFYFRPTVLPAKIKEHIYKNYNHPEIENFLVSHSQTDDINFKRLIKEVQKQDQWKKIELKNYLPELAKLFDQQI